MAVCRLTLLAAVLLVFSSAGAYALEIAGVDVPRAVTVENRELVLNGAGIRKKFIVKVYVGALYLEAKKTTAAGVIADPGAKSIVMTFLYKKVGAEKLIDGWNEGFAKNSSAGELKGLQERINQFNSLFTTVRRGEVIRLDYLPGRGTQVTINNSIKGVVKGEDFSRALLKIWLGAEPADANLKDEMLGHSY